MPQTHLDQLYARFARTGDVAALAAVFDRLAPDLLRIARRLAPESSQAEDLVQEVFLTAIERPQAYDPSRPVGAWLVGVLLNRGREARRREGRPVEVERLNEPSVDAPSDRLEGRELNAALASGIGLLPQGERAAVVGRLLDGVPGPELARQLGISPGNLRVRLHRGLARLRTVLPPSLALGLAGWMRGQRQGLAPLRARLLEAAGRHGGSSPAVRVGTATRHGTWALGTLALAAVVVGVVVTSGGDGRGEAPAALSGDREPQLVNTAAPHARPVRVAVEPRTEVAATKATLRVLVLDGTEQPVTGAEVVVMLSAEVGDAERGATTDGEGRVRFGLDPARQVRGLRVEPTETTGLARDWIRRPAGELDQELVLHVASGGTLAGKVVDKAGRPVAGATVNGWCRTRVEGPPDRVATSDGSGAFVLEHLGPDFVVEARAPGMASTKGLLGNLGPGEESRGHILDLGVEAPLVGQVVDMQGRPVAGVEISKELSYGDHSDWLRTHHPRTRWAPGSTAATTSDASGLFRLEGIAGESISIKANRAPFLGYRGNHRPDHNPQVIVMDLGLSIEGQVFTARGAPAEGAKVSFGPYWGNVQTGPKSALTGPDGRFRLTGMRPKENSPYYLFVLHEGHAVQVVQPIHPDRGGGELVSVTLEPAASIAGRVVDGEGRGRPDVRVWIEGSREMDPGALHSTRNTWEWRADLNETRTDEQGRFVFGRLYPDTFQVHAIAPWNGHERVTTTARSGGEALEIVLTPDQVQGTRVTARLIDGPTGSPITAYTVTPFGPDSSIGFNRKVADPDGRCEIRGLEAGLHDFHFNAEGYSVAEVEDVPLSGESVNLGDVRIWHQASLLFRLVDGEGRPVTRADLEVRSAQGALLKSYQLIGRGGHGVVHGLPSKPLLVSLTWSASSMEVPIDLSSGTNEEIELVLVETPQTQLTLIVLEIGEDMSDAAALEKFVDLAARKDGAGFRQWLASPDAALASAALELVFLDNDGQSRATASMEPNGEEGLKTQTFIRNGTFGTGMSTETGGPSLSLRLQARPYTLRMTSEAYHPVNLPVDLSGVESKELLLILRRR
jgi:RNA polymerase sigma factor (sigma-70 family)